MNERERLLEEYEDAYFAILIHDLAEYEGRQFVEENKKLRDDPDFEVPENVHRASLNKIRRAFRKGKIASGFAFSKRVIYKAAVVFLIVSVLFTSAYAAVPELRARTLNLLIEISDVSASLTMKPHDNEAGEKIVAFDEKTTLLGYSLPYIPSDYELYYVENDNNYSSSHYYVDSVGNYILFSVTDGNYAKHHIDTENAGRIEWLSIGEYAAMLVEKNGEWSATLADTEKAYFISICASDLSREELLLMLEEMVAIPE